MSSSRSHVRMHYLKTAFVSRVDWVACGARIKESFVLDVLWVALPLALEL
jgi:hypothetical protein